MYDKNEIWNMFKREEGKNNSIGEFRTNIYTCKECGKQIKVLEKDHYPIDELAECRAETKYLIHELMFHTYMKHTNPEWARAMLSFSREE